MKFFRNKRKETIWAVNDDGMERVFYTKNGKDYQYCNWHEPDAPFKDRGSILNLVKEHSNNWEEISEEDMFIDML